MLQVLDGLEYLHSQKIIHRDLKLGNLFLNENMGIKIGDFGLATRIDFYGEKKKTICGTPNYIAPEILESKGHSYEVDVWSVGVIIYTLIYGRPPFESKDVKDTYKKIKECTFSFPETVHASNSLKNLVSSILQKDPHKRPTIKDLKGFDFFTESNLPRQPSISFTTQRSHSATKDDRDLSDNGRLYTNNDFGASKDICQKSQEKFLATDRTNSITKSATKDIGRANSHKVLKDSNKNNLDKTPSRRSIAEPKYNYITVKKWIDYSSKYGIGYILSNNMIGVYFNDSTKILTNSEEFFFYIERVEKEDITNRYSFKDHPYVLKKKVSLFNHFKGYLQS
jgi:polo-like kinase 1